MGQLSFEESNTAARNASFVVLKSRSIKPFDFGWYGEDVVFIIPKALQTSLIKELDIFGPPSEWIWTGQPNTLIYLSNKVLAIVWLSVDRKGINIGYFEK